MSLFIGALYFNLPGPLNRTIMSSRDIQDYTGVLFNLCVGMFMMQLNPVILTFPFQRLVFLREENTQMYNVASYFIGKNIVELPIQFLVPCISISIAFWMIGLNDRTPGVVLTYYLIAILQGFSGSSLGLMGGAMFSDPKVATGVVPMLLMPFMLFAGFYANRDSLGDWIAWV